jgi:RNA-directed DNA polymerase
VFGDKRSGGYLLKLSWTPIRRHVLVKGASSPDDPTLQSYWASRRKREVRGLPPQQQRLAHAQKGRCTHCGTSLLNGEEPQVHHLKGRESPDSEESRKLRLVHLYCHQQIHAGKQETEDAKRVA